MNISEQINFYNLANSCGTDKANHHGYHYIYPTFLSHLKNESFNLFEIGYFYGQSYRMWKEYFPKANVYSMDICLDHIKNDDIVFKCDLSNEQEYKIITDKIQTAHVIIDDGSHIPTHQLKAFDYFFNNLLLPGGIYVIEDIECNYWNPNQDHLGYKIGYANVLDFFKKTVDQINSEITGIKNYYNIMSVTYAPNCIVITKKTEEQTNFYNRPYRYQYKI